MCKRHLRKSDVLSTHFKYFEISVSLSQVFFIRFASVHEAPAFSINAALTPNGLNVSPVNLVTVPTYRLQTSQTLS